ncbi:MAG: hypothetical protein WCI05_18915, partial [Myxococcales bacterium]
MWLKRWLLAVAGASVGAAIVAFVEAGAAARASTGTSPPSYIDLAYAAFAVLVPLATLLGASIGTLSILLEPEHARTPGEFFLLARCQPVLVRSRTAAMAPLVIGTATAWCVGTAALARRAFAHPNPLAVG